MESSDGETGPGVTFYTHISDRYAPFHTKVINATVRGATHVLDGLLYHESNLRIEEHYTDTAGFTDHVFVFGLCHLLSFRFASRIRDLADRRLYTAEKAKRYSTLQPFIGGSSLWCADPRLRRTQHSYSDARSYEFSRPALSSFAEQTATGTMSAISLVSLLWAFVSENAFASAKAFGSTFRRRVAHFRSADEVPR
jgi:hypothetical protein